MNIDFRTLDIFTDRIFGGNPLACAASLATIEVMERDGLAERAREKGARFAGAVTRRGSSKVRDFRQIGLMIGIELREPCGEAVARALESELLINVTAENTIRLLPPLIMSDAEADALVDAVSSLVTDTGTPA